MRRRISLEILRISVKIIRKRVVQVVLIADLKKNQCRDDQGMLRKLMTPKVGVLP
jgi:hypothetical protein